MMAVVMDSGHPTQWLSPAPLYAKPPWASGQGGTRQGLLSGRQSRHDAEVSPRRMECGYYTDGRLFSATEDSDGYAGCAFLLTVLAVAVPTWPCIDWMEEVRDVEMPVLWLEPVPTKIRPPVMACRARPTG
jgi:hypothetical protein